MKERSKVETHARTASKSDMKPIQAARHFDILSRNDKWHLEVSFVSKLGNGSVKVRDFGLLFPFSLTRLGRVEKDEINTLSRTSHIKSQVCSWGSEPLMCRELEGP